jgi:signal transduction histidine kinase
MTESITQDLVSFIKEYVNNVYKEYKHLKINNELIREVNVELEKEFSFIFNFKPLEIIIIIDNILSNSQKAKASKMLIHLKQTQKDDIIISFKDNGNGIPEENLDKIFEFGFTTNKRGTGIGLYHVKQIVDRMKGNITVNNKLQNGVEFLIHFSK